MKFELSYPIGDYNRTKQIADYLRQHTSAIQYLVEYRGAERWHIKAYATSADSIVAVIREIQTAESLSAS